VTAADPLADLAALPGVADAVQAARIACEQLRWHPAMRKRAAEVRVEAGVQAARASAALEGARLPAELVRDAARGAVELPTDAAGALVRGAVRAVAEAEHLSAGGGRVLTSAPWQALARLHVAASADLVVADQLGRPRRDDEQPVDDTVGAGTTAPTGAQLTARLESLGQLLSATTTAPVAVIAAVAQAEVLVLRPFVAGNGVVARALARALVVGRGLDPMGAAVPELAVLADPSGYATALAGYRTGTADGVAAWLRYAAGTVARGAEQGMAIADAVLSGRFPRQG
jgi:Fic family protein